MRGPLDVGALAAAYDDLVATHEILRTRLVPAAGGTEAHADVRVHDGAALEVVDDPTCSEDALLAQWDAVEIDPEQPPLVRCCIAHRNGGEHLLGLLFSHAIVDATAVEIAARTLARAYEARLAGGRLPPPDWQYGDYAAWQEERLAGRDDGDVDAWTEALHGLRPPAYRRDHPFVPGRQPVTAQVTVRLLEPAELTAASEWSWRHRSTMFTTLVAAFARALRAEAEGDDVIVMTVFEQRDHPQARRMIGPFTYVTPLLLRIGRDEPWQTTVAHVRARTLETRARAQTPLLSLLPLAPAFIPGTIGVEPTWIRSFNYVPTTYEEYRFGEASGSVVHRGDGMGDAPLAGLRLGLWPAEDGAMLTTVWYDTNELTEASARRIIAALRDQVTCCATT